jgi:hypothetical protein
MLHQLRQHPLGHEIHQDAPFLGRLLANVVRSTRPMTWHWALSSKQEHDSFGPKRQESMKLR